jgi:hypothetical protein
MNLQQNDNISWGESLKDFEPEYFAIRVWNPIQCYILAGRKTVIILDNFIPIEDLKYCIFSPKENRYYFRTYPDIPLWLLMFYKTDSAWDSYDTFLIDFKKKIVDKNIYLLCNPQQIMDTKTMLTRLYKSHFVGEGQLSYITYVALAETCLRYEHFKDNGRNTSGYRTMCKQFELSIKELWDKNYKK